MNENSQQILPFNSDLVIVILRGKKNTVEKICLKVES